ncbi:MAG: hypothetical protein ACP5IE_07895 [Infirmifilum sp.]
MSRGGARRRSPLSSATTYVTTRPSPIYTATHRTIYPIPSVEGAKSSVLSAVRRGATPYTSRVAHANAQHLPAPHRRTSSTSSR